MKKILFSERVLFSRKRNISLFSGIVFFMFLVTNSGSAFAVPSFARQTGLSCAACHTVFPELTAFGRQFKLNGYTMTNIKTITQTEVKKSSKTEKTDLRILKIAPLSAMFQTGFTHVATTIPGTQNNDVEFPQQMSLFYAGQISPHMGSFIQLTLDDGSGTFGMDNTDIRYANTGKGKTPFLYGFTLNNNPTVQDVWNSTPAWGYPYTGSGMAPTPDAGTMIENLGGTVAGLGAYTLIDNLIYLEFSGYRTAQIGAAMPPDASITGALKGIAPYWRVAIQHQWSKSYLEVGTYGMATQLYPAGVSGETDNYTDLALDLQYEYQFAKGQFTLHSSFINEKQNLNSTFGAGDSQNSSNKLNKFALDASLFLRPGVNFTLGYFDYSGSSDNVLYGYRVPQPNSNGFMAQIDYLPWQNTKISLQYTGYGKFDGASTNYDGTNRNASDNNTLYLQLWFLF
ncbi:MAG: cytochrome C [Bacteroidales bacterium]|nr:cytochrome C [Bacteroidales bacterium]